MNWPIFALTFGLGLCCGISLAICGCALYALREDRTPPHPLDSL